MKYTNWRGKVFEIDDAFIVNMKARLIEAGIAEPGELDYLTPEMVIEMLPIMENNERIDQLEEMWGDGEIN
jgi:hypothetical protein